MPEYAPEKGYISHQIANRIRIRLPQRRHDGEYFSHLKEVFSSLPNVERVAVNPATASLLIYHTFTTEALREALATRGLFEIEDDTPQGPPWFQDLSLGLQSLDKKIKALTQGRGDLWSIIFVLFTLMGIDQLIKGNIASSATTMLWYATSVLMIARNQHKASPAL